MGDIGVMIKFFMETKRRFLSILAMICVCLSVSAKQLKVISGSTKVFKEQVEATFEFDYSEATWDYGSSLETQIGDTPECMPFSKTAFINEFNKRTKGVHLNVDAHTPKYKVIVKIENLDSTLGSFYRMMLLAWGTIEVVDLSTGNSVCKIVMKKYRGVSDGDRIDRFKKSFEQLAKDIINL